MTQGSLSLDPPPEPIAELVAACHEYVLRALGFSLDVSPETLPILDHYVSIVREDVRGRPSLLPLVGPAVGAYFGEVVRHKIGMFWRLASPNVVDWQLCARPIFLWFNPLGVAYDALSSADDHGGPSSQIRVAPEDRVQVERRLSDLPPVTETEYYLLTTRLEAIEAAADTARLLQEERGYGDTEFEESDYAAELRPI
jgi:hypothetical protein